MGATVLLPVPMASTSSIASFVSAITSPLNVTRTRCFAGFVSMRCSGYFLYPGAGLPVDGFIGTSRFQGKAFEDALRGLQVAHHPLGVGGKSLVRHFRLAKQRQDELAAVAFRDDA